MSILETVAVFVGIPAAVYAVIAGLVYLSGPRPGRRYRPGRPYDFTPVWFVTNPDGLAAGGRTAIEGSEAGEARPVGVKGGARGSW
jgi:hypothetical protein